MIDGKTKNRAIEWLGELATGEAPFFLAVGFNKPHLPFRAPQKYWDLYPEDLIEFAAFRQDSENGPEIAYHQSGELGNYDDIDKPTTTRMVLSDDKQRELIRGYFACVSMVDDLVGQLLDSLDGLGLAEDTIVVVWGDHGWHLGDHQLWCKHSNFEQATRSPLIIADPQLRNPGVRVTSPTEFVDVYPTLCDLAGLPIPPGLDGVSLRPLMTGERQSVKDVARSQWPQGLPDGMVIGYSVRDERYRYTGWLPREGPDAPPETVEFEEFYDYEDDPLETKNAIDAPRYQADIARLRTRWLEVFGLPASILPKP